MFDKSIITLKRKSPTDLIDMKLSIGNNDTSEILLEHDTIVWKISTEDREYALMVYKKCLKAGELSPAEFIHVQVPKNKKLDYMFCEMM